MKNIHCFPTIPKILPKYFLSDCNHHFWLALQPACICLPAPNWSQQTCIAPISSQLMNLKENCVYLGHLVWQCRLLLGKQLILTLFCTWWLKGRNIADKTRLVLSGKQSSLTKVWSRVQNQELHEFHWPLEKIKQEAIFQQLSGLQWASFVQFWRTPGLNTPEVGKENIAYTRAERLF